MIDDDLAPLVKEVSMFELDITAISVVYHDAIVYFLRGILRMLGEYTEVDNIVASWGEE